MGAGSRSARMSARVFRFSCLEHKKHPCRKLPSCGIIEHMYHSGCLTAYYSPAGACYGREKISADVSRRNAPAPDHGHSESISLFRALRVDCGPVAGVLQVFSGYFRVCCGLFRVCSGLEDNHGHAGRRHHSGKCRKSKDHWVFAAVVSAYTGHRRDCYRIGFIRGSRGGKCHGDYDL